MGKEARIFFSYFEDNFLEMVGDLRGIGNLFVRIHVGCSARGCRSSFVIHLHAVWYINYMAVPSRLVLHSSYIIYKYLHIYKGHLTSSFMPAKRSIISEVFRWL